LRGRLLQATAREQDRKPIYVTGHSLGGALAQIATAVLGTDEFAACYTFGSPRVGNAYFDLWVKPPSYRVMDYADIVPQAPLPIPFLYPYRHSGDARYLPDHPVGSPYRYEPGLPVRLYQLVIGLIQFFGSWRLLGIKDHSIAMYAAKLASIADARTQSRDRWRARRRDAAPLGCGKFAAMLRPTAPSAEARCLFSPCGKRACL